jgi:ribosome-associated heat shock protein Hsp15
MSDDDTDKTRVRLDKWLWAARFYNTRSLAADEIAKGRVQVNGQAAKASREVREGDTIELRQQQSVRTVQVHGLSHVRGPAPVAQALYAETEASIALRAQQAEQRRFGTEPASHRGSPTKRDRRKLADWDRWSAAAEPPPRGRS